MKINHLIDLKRLVGKIDNDFNLSESDWIPRVGAWVIDALSQLKVLPMEINKRKLEVADRIANFPCMPMSRDIRVFDKYGNEIKNAADNKCCKKFNNSPTGEVVTIGVTNVNAEDSASSTTLVNLPTNNCSHQFYIQGNCIELDFDTDEIEVESLEVATYHDDYYDCECPYIYDDGLLLEALAWYVLYKYLSRGSKHPVYSITSQNVYTNPFAQWINIKSKAKKSVLSDMTQGKYEGWNNFFYNSTFLPRS